MWSDEVLCKIFNDFSFFDVETTGDCTVVEDFSSASDLGVIFLAFGVDDFLGVRRGVFFGVVRAFIVWFVVFVVVEDRGMFFIFC